ncbi:hypothetical protein Pyn_31119 [Prunus yedoensis var. nudiflora]|uniref:Uncharacterized protein n=1 Tax=Prunus yedoensis var. nudiflora TaxID=2094558 RepID=A0A314ZEY7_PRUYE|nr:hypothetical protein Pyn_31119 [Prunus yedoensis var. nudiflora]
MRQPIFFGTKAEQEMEASNIPVSMPRVNLKDTIEELLKFTLQSCTNGTLEIDLGLPKELCPASQTRAEQPLLPFPLRFFYWYV